MALILKFLNYWRGYEAIMCDESASLHLTILADRAGEVMRRRGRVTMRGLMADVGVTIDEACWLMNGIAGDVFRKQIRRSRRKPWRKQ